MFEVLWKYVCAVVAEHSYYCPLLRSSSYSNFGLLQGMQKELNQVIQMVISTVAQNNIAIELHKQEWHISSSQKINFTQISSEHLGLLSISRTHPTHINLNDFNTNGCRIVQGLVIIFVICTSGFARSFWLVSFLLV